jgi:hypothetical protein
MLFDPASAVIVPLHVPAFRPFGVETTNPDGSVSEKATPVNAVEFGLVIVKLSAVVSPGPNSCSWESANDLAMVGGWTTVIVAVAAAPITP